MKLLTDSQVVKIGKAMKSQKLDYQEEAHWNKFLKWFSECLKNGKIELFYRGTTKRELKARIKAKYQTEDTNPWINYLFHFGEKSKAYLLQDDDKNIENQLFLSSINELSKTSLMLIFEKINDILNCKTNSVVKKFNSSNLELVKYFNDFENQFDFSNKILNMPPNEAFTVRNYYLRLLHTLYSFGKKNNLSYFVSSTSKERIARKFAIQEDGILILYWLPIPIDRFGLSLGIIQELAPLIGKAALPMYFSEFYPDDDEYSLLGGLFPNNIIGYYDDQKIVLNPHLLRQNDFNDETIEKGFFVNNIDHQRLDIAIKTNYAKQLLLSGNSIFWDR